MESEWIEYDSAGYPHKREQPQGEATSDTPDTDVELTTEQLGLIGQRISKMCEPHAQTEGGEKPRGLATNATSATKAALDELAKAEQDEGLYDRVTCPTCKGRKWIHAAEPDSPPSQPAGGAREFEIEQSGDEWIVFFGGVCVEECEFYEEAEGFVELWKPLIEAYAAQQVRHEREARERAESAFTEANRRIAKAGKVILDHMNDEDYEMSLAGLFSYLTEEYDEALASLKSSEGAK